MTKETDIGSKNWNFPKNHMHQHLFDDIVAKGVTRNYNTKYDEAMHRPLKDSYALRTNFRNIAQQVCNILFAAPISCLIL